MKRDDKFVKAEEFNWDNVSAPFGFKGRYVATVDGEVYRAMGNGIYKLVEGIPSTRGYLDVAIRCDDGQFRKLRLHDVIYYAFNERNEGCEIHHVDGSRTNNNLSNLVELTRTAHKRLHQGQAIEVYDLYGKLIFVASAYNEISEVFGFPRTSIMRHAQNGTVYKGFFFKMV